MRLALHDGIPPLAELDLIPLEGGARIFGPQADWVPEGGDSVFEADLGGLELEVFGRFWGLMS